MISGNLSVPPPLHHVRNTTLFYYEINSILPTVQNLFPGSCARESNCCRAMLTCLKICAIYNMRITELLSVTSANVLPGCRVLCQGLKKSHSYIIFLPRLNTFMSDQNFIKKHYKLFPYTYMQCYRSSKSVGIQFSQNGNLNSSVTHSSRYSVASIVSENFGEITASNVLRHKSKSTINYYLK